MAYLSPGLAQFKVTYELSPIIFVGGIASNVTGGMIPIISITDSANYDLGLLSSSTDVVLDDFFAYYRPLPGATLEENEYGQYPFGNQTIAANAVIVQPLKVSLLMMCPARIDGDYVDKINIFTALKSTIDNHVNLGGLFNVATPSYIYTNCLLNRLQSVDPGGTEQVQYAWQWDFFQPLVTLAGAQAAQNTQMAKISSQTQTSGDPPASNAATAGVGNPGSNLASSAVPAARQPAGTSVPGPTGPSTATAMNGHG